MRWESCLVILFQACVMVLLGLSPKAWLIMFAIHGFVWSSQNYVNHAFSPRDIINGAHNLKMPLWLYPCISISTSISPITRTRGFRGSTCLDSSRTALAGSASSETIYGCGKGRR